MYITGGWHKNGHSLNVESYILFSGDFYDFKQESAFQVTMGELLPGGEEEESGYIEVCYKGAVVRHQKHFYGSKKTRYLNIP